MHILIKDTETDRVRGYLCFERGIQSATIVAASEEAAAALGKIAAVMDVDEVLLLHFPGDEEPNKEDGWRLTDAKVYARQAPGG